MELAPRMHQSPEEQLAHQKEVLRDIAIENATAEELQDAITQVRQSIEEGENVFVNRAVLRQLEDALAKKSPDALH